jgi:hypothetical protein
LSLARPVADLRLTGTLVSQYFRFSCDRQLRWEMVPRALRGGEVPAPNADPSRGPLVGQRPGMGLLTQAGRRWERHALQRLVDRHGGRVRFAGRDERGAAARLPYEALVESLREPGDCLWLVQPELRIVDRAAFAARFGFPEAVEIAPAQPDLVRIGRDRRGRLMLGVADIKWSREGTLQHYVQVAFYTVLLQEICRAEGIDATVEARWGWLWTRGSRGPKRFSLAAYRHHVEEFLRDELPRVAAAAPAEVDWHLRPRCTSCTFFHQCRAEADAGDRLSRVVGLTPLAGRELKARGIRSVRELRKAEFRKGVYAGCHALESAESTLKKRVQALDYQKLVPAEKQSFRMPVAERVRVLLSAEGDPVSGTVFALGLRAGQGDSLRGAAEVFVSAAGTEAAEREMLGRFLLRAGEVVARAEAEQRKDGFLSGRAPRPVHFYLWDRREAELLRDCLQRHLGDPGTQPGMAGIARILFPGDAGAAPPGTVVLDVVSELFALPVPYAWDLAGVSGALTPVEGAWTHAPRGDYGWPLSSQVAFERIHNVWNARPHRAGGAVQAPGEVRAEIVRTVESKLAAVDSVIRAIRDHAAKRRDPMLRLDAGFGAAADGAGPIQNATLEQLRLFTLAEAAEESVSIRQLHALPTADRARRFECIAGLNKVQVLPNGHAVFEFDEACREAKFRPGDFALVLTNDDGRTLAETDVKPWLRRKLMVELIDYDLAASPPRVTLASDLTWEKLETDRLARAPLLDLDRVCVLDRASVDFNTRRVVASLRALADGAGQSEFVLGALHGIVPPDWVAPLDADAGWADAIVPTLATRGYALNAEQEAAWRAVFERAVSVVWGPPGTGKTYLLAWMLIGMAAAARRAGRPLRMLVAAATHRAIVNVLAKVARELESAGTESPLRAVKLAGRGSEADEDLAGLDVDVIRDDHLPRELDAVSADGMPVVVGSTVWSLWKQMRDINRAEAEKESGPEIPIRSLFDVIVIDEASQMKVPDALIALSSIRRGGRLVLCGDDRQLAPILHGSYPREETLFGSAFTHFATHFGRMALRESRRMNRALVRWPRRLFYPGFVSMDPDRRLSLTSAAAPADPVDALLWDVFLRPEDAVVFCTYEGFRATVRNPFEAGLVARIARLARVGMRDPATGETYTAERFRSHALAVIAPHRAQNSAILGELIAGGWPRDELPVVDTVERMQGNERELIIVSYSVADREYAEREAAFLLNPNRFNVSITRPRSKLIVFMSDEILRTVPGDEQVMTDSMAIKGYPAHFRSVRQLEIAAPDGTPVPMTVRTRSLAGF